MIVPRLLEVQSSQTSLICYDYTVKYQPEINKSHPLAVATIQIYTVVAEADTGGCFGCSSTPDNIQIAYAANYQPPNVPGVELLTHKLYDHGTCTS